MSHVKNAFFLVLIEEKKAKKFLLIEPQFCLLESITVDDLIISDMINI